MRRVLSSSLVACLVLFSGRSLQALSPPDPHLATLTPSRGSINGGTVVQLNGEAFDRLPAGTPGVLFGDDAATDVQVVSPTLITCVSPPHRRGQVYVKIAINGDGQPRYGRRGFTYEDPDVPSTTTTTTLRGATTTTTTLGCGDCSDGDPCTIDSCAAGTCKHTASVSPLDLVAQTGACSGQTLPKVIGGRFARACQLVTEAQMVPGSQAARHDYKVAIRVFGRAIRAARRSSHRAQQPVSSSCAGGLESLLDAGRSRAKALKGP